jgi:hypothetical protein
MVAPLETASSRYTDSRLPRGWRALLFNCRLAEPSVHELREQRAGQGVFDAMHPALSDEHFSDVRSKPRKFADWLHRTMGRLKGHALPPESWERGLSPIEHLAAQRRILELTESIAAPVKKKQY